MAGDLCDFHKTIKKYWTETLSDKHLDTFWQEDRNKDYNVAIFKNCDDCKDDERGGFFNLCEKHMDLVNLQPENVDTHTLRSKLKLFQYQSGRNEV